MRSKMVGQMLTPSRKVIGSPSPESLRMNRREDIFDA